MNIMLIGFKNSGKTTIGKKLASFLNKKFFDIDEIIEELFYKKYEKNLKVSLIFNFLKKQKFKEIETEAILSLKNIKNAVIATSGSFILNEDNFNILKNLTKIVYLKVSKEILKKRVQEDKENTIFKNDKFFEKEYEKRKDLYSKKAFFTLQADDINFDEILRIIKGKINE
ncbi:MAG: Shikimate kinase [Candidatus Anoxychlamydiales bacterium]|nr:Shikimate kinase [Candidatus Anoxychlamydiales bacterium]NGX35501.1 Shikimate kinase [Candidatus Anoxychlamydiales bacterium]